MLIRTRSGPRGRPLIELWYVSYLLFGLVIYGLATILLPLVVVAAGHRPFRIGAVVAVQNVGLLSAPAWGFAMDRLGRHRLVLVAGSLLIAAGFLVLSSCRGLDALLAAAGVIGIGTAATATATIIFVVGSRPQSEWSERIGYLQLFNSIGTTLGLACSGLLPVRTGTLAGVLLALVSALLIRVTLPATVRAPPDQPDSNLIQHWVVAPPARRKTALLLLLACWFLLCVAISCFSSQYPLLMRRIFSIGVTRSSGLMAIATLLGLPLYALTGWMIRTIGSAAGMTIGIACRAACLLGIGALSILGHGFAPGWIYILAGLFQGSWPIISVSANDQLFRTSALGKGLSSGLMNFVGASASAVGALIAGLAAEIGGYRSVAGVAGVIALVALGLALVHLSRQSRPVPAPNGEHPPGPGDDQSETALSDHWNGR